jgi:hypothetical protein
VNSLPLIYADFQNADAQGRVRLNCVGTVKDLARQQVQLGEGVLLVLYSDDVNDQGQEARLIADGTATYSQIEQCWVAVINWDKVRHESETNAAAPDGSGSLLGARLVGGGSETPTPTRPTSR